MSTFVKDIETALKDIVVPSAVGTDVKEKDAKKESKLAPAPEMVNAFNYTGTVYGDVGNYEYADFLPSFPEVSWEPLEEFQVDDRAKYGDKAYKRLNREIEEQGGSIKWVNPTLGVNIVGASIKKLSTDALDDLALLIATRGVVFFRNQADLSIDEQTEIGKHWGRLHNHATTGVPRKPGYEHVHVVYADQGTLPDKTAFSSQELYHSDVTYELQPPGPTLLKLISAPAYGGDTLFTSGAAVYSSFSPEYQKYLDSLYAAHSGFEQAKGAQGAGQHVRRQPIETIHPVVRVNPTTGIKSVFINSGFTRRIVGVPKAESDNTLRFLNDAFALNPEFTARVQWEKDDLVIWDNRVVNHSATFDFWPERRHAVRITPHGERPISVQEYEQNTGKKALNWSDERYRQLGFEAPKIGGHARKERGFKD